VPARAGKGEAVKVDPRLADRLARFHLTPRRAMTSEGGILRREDVKAARLAPVVEGVTPERVRLRLAGFVHTGTAFDKDRATAPDGPPGFGFQAPPSGVLEYDRVRKAFVRFDAVAPGEVWGRWEPTRPRADKSVANGCEARENNGYRRMAPVVRTLVSRECYHVPPFAS